jgi:hypothetical protein
MNNFQLEILLQKIKSIGICLEHVSTSSGLTVRYGNLIPLFDIYDGDKLIFTLKLIHPRNLEERFQIIKKKSLLKNISENEIITLNNLVNDLKNYQFLKDQEKERCYLEKITQEKEKQELIRKRTLDFEQNYVSRNSVHKPISTPPSPFCPICSGGAAASNCFKCGGNGVI